YVYPRCGGGTNVMVPLVAGGLKMNFNRHFGGTLWTLEYDRLNYLNIHDLGRQAQVSGRWSNNVVEHVFSECGMGEQENFADPRDPNQRMGAICLQAGVNAGGAFGSEAIPVEFKADTAKQMGGGVFRPVLYRSLRVRKTVTPDFHGIPGCIQWRHTIAAGADLIQQPWYQHEIVSAHIVCVFSNYFRYNLVADKLERQPHWGAFAGGQMLRVTDCSYQCQIFTDNSRRHAFGLMFKDEAQGGSVEEIVGFYWKNRAPYPRDGMGVFDQNCIALFGLRHEPFRLGANDSVAYLFVGDFATVTNCANKLFQLRAAVPWK
ncbi:MAG: hypothetical protein NTZ16_07135, partial [Verrucomicrobia bacterium]|nr:hypothetical protein [Verrucomicrobiota bacterium]